jgi:hypothetical protein
LPVRRSFCILEQICSILDVRGQGRGGFEPLLAPSSPALMLNVSFFEPVGRPYQLPC